MSITPRHVLIAHATWAGNDAEVSAMDDALNHALPNTHALLHHWQALDPRRTPAQPQSQPDHTLDWATPLERAWANALGWQANTHSDVLHQPLPLAALEIGPDLPPDTPAAWLMPVHLLTGMNDVRLSHPNHLQLSDAHSRALMAALQPLCEEDGVSLRYASASRWLLVGERLRGIVSPSVAKACDQAIDASLPFSHTHPAAAQWMRRLQNEAQMLFYTHAVHDQRRAQGLAPINGVWLQGAGALTQALSKQASHVTLVYDLANQAHMPLQWQAAWTTLDHSTIASLVEQGDTQPIVVSFASDQGLRCYASPAYTVQTSENNTATHHASLWQRIQDGAVQLKQMLQHGKARAFKRTPPKRLPSALMPD
jgi:hypothetical protein